MAQKIRAGVIGYGLSATVFHIPFLLENPDFHLVAILERSETGKAGQNHPGVTVVRNLEALLALNLDLIVISTPPETHVPMAKAALLANCHVVVEKPFCPTYAEADELRRLAEQQKRVLAVYQNRRFDSDFQTVQEVIRSGKLGTVVEYEAHYDRFRPDVRTGIWKEEGDLPGSGILYDLGSHLLDQVLVLFGTPERITASLFRDRVGTKIDDGFHVTLQYPHLRATVKASMLVAKSRPRFAVYGSRGSFEKHGLDVQEPQLRAGGTLQDAHYGVEPEENRGTLVHLENGALREEKIPTHVGNYRLFYRHLSAAIQGKGAGPVEPSSAANVVKAIEKAYQSHRENRSVSWD